MRSRNSRPLPDDLGVYGLPGDVSPWDLRFDPEDRAHLEQTKAGIFRIRIWAEPELCDGMLVVRGPGGDVTGHPLHLVARSRFGFWESEIGPFSEAVHYSFAFRNQAGRPVYFVPSGISVAVERLDRWTLDPAAVPTVDVPDWVQGAVIYQIFPDRFARLVGAPSPEDLSPWDIMPHSRTFTGGDLAGVASRLDYLQWLGTEVLYLNPVFRSPSNHRYDTIDYYEVDPRLGGNDALRSLIEAVHDRDMRLILDASFNHVHPRFFAFADLVQKGPRSEYADWFRVHEWPIRVRHRPQSPRRAWEWVKAWETELGVPIEEVPGDGPPVEATYETWYGVPSMPRLDLTNPQARAYVLEVARYWVAEFGIDGWRMDVVRYVEPDFWNDFRRVVKAENPDAYLLSEVMGDARAWLQGDRFDATMNYTFRDLVVRFLATEELDGAAFLDDAARLVYQQSWPVTLANQNLIGSHDTPRFLTQAGDEMWRLRLATVLQLTFPGAPGIYYGDEVGLRGGDDPGSRGTFPWHPDPADHDLARTISGLAKLRRAQPALARGGWRPLWGSRHVVSFERSLNGRRVVVMLNRGRGPATIELRRRPGSLRWGEANITGRNVRLAGKQAAVIW